MRSKFPDASTLLSLASLARSRCLDVDNPGLHDVEESVRLDRLILKVIDHNDGKPISDGMAIYRAYLVSALIVEDANTPEMLELPEGMRELPEHGIKVGERYIIETDDPKCPSGWVGVQIIVHTLDYGGSRSVVYGHRDDGAGYPVDPAWLVPVHEIEVEKPYLFRGQRCLALELDESDRTAKVWLFEGKTSRWVNKCDLAAIDADPRVPEQPPEEPFLPELGKEYTRDGQCCRALEFDPHSEDLVHIWVYKRGGARWVTFSELRPLASEPKEAC